MLIPKVKKLLSVVLVFTLLIASITQVGVFTASAENTAPVYNSKTQTIIGTYNTGLLTNNTVEFQEMEGITDETKAVYTNVTVEKSSNYGGAFSPYVMLAETDHKESADDTSTYYLGLRLTAGSGWALALWNENGSVQTKSILYNQTYADGTNTMPDSVEIACLINDGKASVWLEGIQLVVDYSNDGYNIIKPVLGSYINGYGYYLSGQTWVDNKVVEEPVYNAETQTVIATYGTGMLTNGTVEFQTMEGIADETKAVYTNVTVEKSSNYGGWYSPYIMLAETDHKESADDTSTYYLGLRLTAGNSWVLALWNETGSVQTKSIIYDQTYADGTNTMPDSVEITCLINDGKASVWLEGIQLVVDYSNDGYNIIKPVLGSYINGYGYYLSGQTWVDNGNVITDDVEVLEPTYDAKNHAIVSNYNSSLLTNNTVEFQTMEGIIDITKAVYTNVTVEKSSNYGGAFSPYVMLAETNHKESADDTSTYYLGLRLTAGNGWALALWNENGSVQTKSILYNQTYADGTNIMPDSVEITCLINDGKASVWLEGVQLVVDYSNNGYNIIKPVLGSYINGYGYLLSGKTWVDKDNKASDMPEFNSETDALMYNKGEVVLSDEGLVKYDAYYVEDYYAPIHTEYTIKKEDYVIGWNSPCIALAETDFVSGNSEYYLGIRMTAEYGYSICLINDAMEQTQYIVDNVAYPDTGTGTMSNDEYIVTVLTDNGTVSVWLNGLKILDEYSNEEVYTIMGPAACGYINGYSFGLNVMSWTAIDNYNRLGDLNGDASINLLDFVRMKKIAAGVEGVAAINDCVIAFNSNGTITAEELTLMRKYILGVIDSFDAPIEYGYDAVSALELQ